MSRVAIVPVSPAKCKGNFKRVATETLNLLVITAWPGTSILSLSFILVWSAGSRSGCFVTFACHSPKITPRMRGFKVGSSGFTFFDQVGWSKVRVYPGSLEHQIKGFLGQGCCHHDGRLVLFQNRQPGLNVFRMLKAATDAAPVAEKRRAHFRHQFLFRIRVTGRVPSIVSCQSARMSGPVGQFVEPSGMKSSREWKNGTRNPPREPLEKRMNLPGFRRNHCQFA